MKAKKFISVLFGSLVVVFGLSTSVAWAVESTTNSTTSADVKTTAQATTLSDDDKKKLLERLTKRKTDLKTKLTNAQKTRLQTKCKAAQGVLAPIKAKVQGYEKGRGDVYGKVATKLTDLSTKVKDQGIDTKDLDAAITTLQAKVTTFNTDIETYKQAVSDMADMECATDPEAFQASLQAARTSLDKVSKDATEIRNHIKDTIKPILTTLKQQLEAEKAEN